MTDGGRTEEGRTDGGRTDRGRTEEGRTDGGRTDGGRTDGGRTDGGRTEEGRTDGQPMEGTRPGSRVPTDQGTMVLSTNSLRFYSFYKCTLACTDSAWSPIKAEISIIQRVQTLYNTYKTRAGSRSGVNCHTDQKWYPHVHMIPEMH